MKLHLSSFLLGFGVGASTAVVAPRLRPVALELATTCYKIADALLVRAARTREDVSDLLAEARARARHRLRRPEPIAA